MYAAAAGVSSNVLLGVYRPDGPGGVTSRPRRFRRFFFDCGFSVTGEAAETALARESSLCDRLSTGVDAFACVSRSPSALSIRVSADAATRSIGDGGEEARSASRPA